MATLRLTRLEVFQPVIGSDPQLYTYNCYLADVDTGAPSFVQVTSEYPAELNAGDLCQAIKAAIDPDLYDDPTCA